MCNLVCIYGQLLEKPLVCAGFDTILYGMYAWLHSFVMALASTEAAKQLGQAVCFSPCMYIFWPAGCCSDMLCLVGPCL